MGTDDQKHLISPPARILTVRTVQLFFYSRDEAIKAGFRPCGGSRP